MSFIALVLLFLISMVFLLSLWLLAVPVSIVVDSLSNRYEVAQWGTIRFNFDWADGPVFHLSVFGFNVPLTRTSRQKYKKTVRKESTRRFKRSLRQWLSLVQDMFDCFSVRQFRVSIDTGDVVLNAKLVPVAVLFSHGTGSIQINFINQTYIYLTATFYPAKAVYFFLRFYFKH